MSNPLVPFLNQALFILLFSVNKAIPSSYEINSSFFQNIPCFSLRKAVGGCPTLWVKAREKAAGF